MSSQRQGHRLESVDGERATESEVLTIEVRRTSAPGGIEGTITGAGAVDREFSGWLELISALEGWRSSPSTDGGPPVLSA